MKNTLRKRICVVAVGAAVNILLFFVKLYIGLSTNSVAIYADSLNSLTDFAVCIAVIIGFWLSASQKTEEYPFGKGRAEELTELLISAVILAFIFRKEKSPIPKSVIRTKVTDYVPTFLLAGTIVLLICASFIENKPDITNGLICIGFFLIGALREIFIKKK